jgi:hypothetical protein
MQLNGDVAVYRDLQRLWRPMKYFRMNSPLLVLAAAMVTAAPFVGLAWRTREWLGW